MWIDDAGERGLGKALALGSPFRLARFRLSLEWIPIYIYFYRNRRLSGDDIGCSG